MRKDELYRVAATPFCQAVMLEGWDAPPGRFFLDYRARHGFTSLIGNGVVDEFRTISGPILLAPTSIVGGVYDAGMRLADERDVEAPLDQGWPPLTIGIDVAAPTMPGDWKTELVKTMQGKSRGEEFELWATRVHNIEVGDHRISILQCLLDERPAATVIVTDAPLLPQQLGRLADTDNAPLSVAVATGNRLPRVGDGELHVANVAAESTLLAMSRKLQQFFRE